MDWRVIFVNAGLALPSPKLLFMGIGVVGRVAVGLYTN